METTLKKLVIKQIINHANANNLNKVLRTHGQYLSVNNYMKVETALRLRRMTNQQINQELRYLNRRQHNHTRPNNANGLGIIRRRRAELISEYNRRRAI